jgi:diguanylate cyclase (GGDEF)-like protein
MPITDRINHYLIAFTKWFFTFFARVVNIKIDEERFPNEHKHLLATITFDFQIAYILTWTTYVVLYTSIGCYLSASFCFFLGIVPSFIGIWVLKRNTNYIIAGLLSNIGSATAIFMITNTTGMASSAVMPWLLVLLVGTYLQLGKRGGNFMTIYVFFLYCLMAVFDYYKLTSWYELPFAQDSFYYTIFNIYNFAFCTLIIALIILIFVSQFDKGYQFIKDSKAQIKQLNEELYKKAHTDELTNIYNRRALVKMGNTELLRASRNKETITHFPTTESAKVSVKTKEATFKNKHELSDYVGSLSVAILDLDYFKKVNDTYGHDTGDRVLILFSSIMTDCFRKTDIVGRYGGEEFLIIFPDTSAELAKLALVKLQSAIAKQSVRSDDETEFYFTFSGGVTEFMVSDETIDEIIKRADNALYEAKLKGRNRIEIN